MARTDEFLILHDALKYLVVYFVDTSLFHFHRQSSSFVFNGMYFYAEFFHGISLAPLGHLMTFNYHFSAAITL
jgi:hypothetical protein